MEASDQVYRDHPIVTEGSEKTPFLNSSERSLGATESNPSQKIN